MKDFCKRIFRFIDITLYWIWIFLVPIILFIVTAVYTIPDHWMKFSILTIMCIILAYRNYELESSTTNYYIVPIEPVNQEMNDAIEDYFCRQKIRTKKIYINQRIKHKEI